MRTRKTNVDKKVATKSLSAEVAPTYDALVSAIESLVRGARTGLKAALNTIMLQTYWRTGEYIVEYEQHGSDRAAYGVGLIRCLARDLTLRLGKGFSRSNLQYMQKVYLVSQKSQTSGFFKKGQTSGFLTWSHYLEILRADDPLEIAFYAKECENSKWSVRELHRQMQSMLFHRIALSRDKEGVLALANRGDHVQKPEDILRDPYVLEFAGLPVAERLKENRLHSALIEHLRDFLLELGRGFTLAGRQYRVPTETSERRIDLVFYNYIPTDISWINMHSPHPAILQWCLAAFKKTACWIVTKQLARIVIFVMISRESAFVHNTIENKVTECSAQTNDITRQIFNTTYRTTYSLVNVFNCCINLLLNSS